MSDPEVKNARLQVSGEGSKWAGFSSALADGTGCICGCRFLLISPTGSTRARFGNSHREHRLNPAWIPAENGSAITNTRLESDQNRLQASRRNLSGLTEASSDATLSERQVFVPWNQASKEQLAARSRVPSGMSSKEFFCQPYHTVSRKEILGDRGHGGRSMSLIYR